MTLGQLEAICIIWPRERPAGANPMTDLSRDWVLRAWAIKKLRKALRSERLRAKTAHWSVCPARAFALQSALQRLTAIHEHQREAA